MCKKLLFVTNCDPKETNLLEKSLKDIYLKKDPKPALSFSHRGTRPYEIADVVKKKKTTAVVFGETVSPADMIAIMNAVKRNGHFPKFLHIHPKEILIGVEPVLAHEEVLGKLAA